MASSAIFATFVTGTIRRMVNHHAVPVIVAKKLIYRKITSSTKCCNAKSGTLIEIQKRKMPTYYGKVVEGILENEELHGEGKIVTGNTVCEGMFEYGLLHGRGKITITTNYNNIYIMLP